MASAKNNRAISGHCCKSAQMQEAPLFGKVRHCCVNACSCQCSSKRLSFFSRQPHLLRAQRMEQCDP